jgi:hypothetical protein
MCERVITIYKEQKDEENRESEKKKKRGKGIQRIEKRECV